VTEDEITDVSISGGQQAQASTTNSCWKRPKDENERWRKDLKAGRYRREEADDELYQDAVRHLLRNGRASTSTLQRRLRIGYGRAAPFD